MATGALEVLFWPKVLGVGRETAGRNSARMNKNISGRRRGFWAARNFKSCTTPSYRRPRLSYPE